MKGDYERELKNILQGKRDILMNITKSCSPEEKEKYFKIMETPFTVVRAAGSFGIDLVAVRGDISLLIEIKSSNRDTIHFSSQNRKLQKQAHLMREECKKSKTLPIYAFRLKNCRGDAWRVFTLDDMDCLIGRAKIIHKKLPKIKKTNNGNLIMKWDTGMSLAEFIDYINYLCK
ncbi:MAG TPA: Holliday junction resolvase [Thermoplasmatales archaeon]|nr:Holliday junction resolvase [Thermoplasmatales archaeon]